MHHLPHARNVRRCVLALLLLVAVLAPASGATAQTTDTAAAVPTGTVSGTVTGPGGVPVAGVEVSIGYFDGAIGETGVDGTYELEVPVGNQVVEFIPPQGSELAPQFWEGVYSGPDPLRVTAGAEITGIDAELEVGATISGTVTDPDGDPLPGGEVWVYAWWDNPGFALSTEVGVDGTYTVTGIPPGHQVVSFEPPIGSGLVGEYWDDVYAPAQVDLIKVTLGQDVTGIDASLSEGGSISGTVTDPFGFGVSEAYVTAESVDGTMFVETSTDNDGDYELTDLVPGSYIVYFEDVFGDFVPEYYDDSFTFEGATEVVVTAGTPTDGIDAELAMGGSIAGRLTGLDGRSAGDVVVQVLSEDGDFFSVGFTDASGRYSVSQLAPGDYTVAFRAEHGTEWFDDHLRQADADLVTVLNDEITEGIGGALDRIVFGDDFFVWDEDEWLPIENDTRVVAQCDALDPSTFHFEVDGFDSSDGTTSGTIDFGDGSPDFVFDSSGDMVDHTFPWPGGLATGDPFEVEVSLDGGPAFTDSYTIVPGETGCGGTGAPSFSDVPATHPFYDEIECLVDLGVTQGYPDGTFRPGEPITRQAVVAWIWRLAGEPDPSSPPEFTDVPEGHPFEDAIAWATEAGIVTGYPDGSFRPGAEVSREAVAAFLWRFAGEPPADAPADFTDVNESMAFHDAIAWLQEAEITEGFPDGSFRPVNEITRQALAAWICRFADLPLNPF